MDDILHKFMYFNEEALMITYKVLGKNRWFILICFLE